jgi:hypothetical protein
MVAMTHAPRRMSPTQIAEHATQHRKDCCPFDPSVPIDFSKPFLCPSLTALYYTSIWEELSAEDQIRYTQLSAMSFNELTAWFEQGFSATLQVLSQSARVAPELRVLLSAFIEDEGRHQAIWWSLNRCADPARYKRDTPAITRIAPIARTLMKWLAKRPLEYPVAVWLMLILEEHGNEIARRCAMRRPDEIEEHFAAAYLAHVRDETRHVQIDWHLLDSLWPRLDGWRLQVNIRLFRLIIGRLLFSTEHAAISVTDELIRERPGLRRLGPRIRAELREVGRRAEFRAMLFSAQSTPIAFHLLERFPDLQSALA